MVNVTHYTDNGRTVKKHVLGVLHLVKELLFNADHDLSRGFNTEIIGNKCCRIKINNLVNGSHHAHEHQLLYNLACRYVQLGGELTNHNLLRKLDRRRLVGNGLLLSDGSATASLGILSSLCKGL